MFYSFVEGAKKLLKIVFSCLIFSFSDLFFRCLIAFPRPGCCSVPFFDFFPFPFFSLDLLFRNGESIPLFLALGFFAAGRRFVTYFGGVWIWKSGVQIHSFSVEVPDGAGISLSPSPPPLGFSVLVQAWATIATHSDPASSASTVQSYFYCLPEGKPMLSICSILSPCRDSAVAINIFDSLSRCAKVRLRGLLPFIRKFLPRLSVLPH